jgi:hypothetical protein
MRGQDAGINRTNLDAILEHAQNEQKYEEKSYFRKLNRSE